MGIGSPVPGKCRGLTPRALQGQRCSALLAGKLMLQDVWPISSRRRLSVSWILSSTVCLPAAVFVNLAAPQTLGNHVVLTLWPMVSRKAACSWQNSCSVSLFQKIGCSLWRGAMNSEEMQPRDAQWSAAQGSISRLAVGGVAPPLQPV